jgi:autotransporter passenger strand-loop-strand repeat protein
VAVSTTVRTGGDEIISFGGSATDTLLQSGGTIDVRFLGYASGGTASVTAGDLLTVSVGGGSYTQQLVGTYSSFHLAPDGTRDTDILLGPPCFCEGTRIATERGLIAVEALSPGDRVHTLPDGTLRPVVWLGRRHIDCRGYPDPNLVSPVLLRAGAYARGCPIRDLFLSPDHAVLVDGALIPVRYLVNGTTIGQEPVDGVTYYHIELAGHDVIVAEGLPCESYLDTGNLAGFERGDVGASEADLLGATIMQQHWAASPGEERRNPVRTRSQAPTGDAFR